MSCKHKRRQTTPGGRLNVLVETRNYNFFFFAGAKRLRRQKRAQRLRAAGERRAEAEGPAGAVDSVCATNARNGTLLFFSRFDAVLLWFGYVQAQKRGAADAAACLASHAASAPARRSPAPAPAPPAPPAPVDEAVAARFRRMLHVDLDDAGELRDNAKTRSELERLKRERAAMKDLAEKNEERRAQENVAAAFARAEAESSESKAVDEDEEAEDLRPVAGASPESDAEEDAYMQDAQRQGSFVLNAALH